MDDQAMAAFPRMAELLPEAERGLARVRHLTLEGEAARRANYVAGEYIPTPPGAYALLFIKSESGSSTCMMSDLSYERSTCLEVVERAHGDVLIAGLGLGMILHPILEKLEVERVTLVEKFPDVIALISPTLPTTSKLTIVTADIFEWTPPPSARFDVIWFDIWPDVALSRLAEMAELHRRFAPYLKAENPACWMESWHRQESERILAHTAAASL
jgi:hypothetical protein